MMDPATDMPSIAVHRIARYPAAAGGFYTTPGPGRHEDYQDYQVLRLNSDRHRYGIFTVCVTGPDLDDEDLPTHTPVSGSLRSLPPGSPGVPQAELVHIGEPFMVTVHDEESGPGPKAIFLAEIRESSELRLVFLREHGSPRRPMDCPGTGRVVVPHRTPDGMPAAACTECDQASVYVAKHRDGVERMVQHTTVPTIYPA